MLPDSREVAEEIIDLIFHTPHIDEGTPLEEIHLLESIADILDENFRAIEREFEQIEELGDGV